MSQQKTRSTRTKFTSMGKVTISKSLSGERTNSPFILNAHRPHLFSYSNFNHRADGIEKLPTLPKSSIAGHQVIIQGNVDFDRQLPFRGADGITRNSSHVYPITNTNKPDYQPYISFNPYSYFDLNSHFPTAGAERVNRSHDMQEYNRSIGHHATGFHRPRSSSAYENSLRLNEACQVPPRSHKSQSKETKARDSTRYDCKVDHTYRDFSGVSPSTEDLKRYENKVKEHTRRKNTRTDDSTSNKIYSTGSSQHRPMSVGASLARRGRGNKASQNRENAFVGFMGTNFPARLHDLLSHEDDVGDIITWLPHGRSWVVRDKTAFLEKVAPTHFQITKFESFTRQVNGWGFKRITQGPDINSYYHELFLRGMPHLIQWMKRVSATGVGKRRLRADPTDEPNFYEISLKYPIPDYYNQNRGQPLSLLKSSLKLPEKDKDNDKGKQELSRLSSVSKNQKSLSGPKKNMTVCEQQQGDPLRKVSNSELIYCDSSNSMVTEHPTRQYDDATTCDNHVFHDHCAFYHMPMLSPAYLLSPKITDQHPKIKDNHSLQDVTSEQFWTSNTAISRLDPRPILRTAANGEEDGNFYDVIVAPAVSNEESSESCTNDLVPTNKQWESICDLLLEDMDVYDHDNEMHANDSCQNANSSWPSMEDTQDTAFAPNMNDVKESRTSSKEFPPRSNPDKNGNLPPCLECSTLKADCPRHQPHDSNRNLEYVQYQFEYENNSWEDLNYKNPSTVFYSEEARYPTLDNLDESYLVLSTLKGISKPEPLKTTIGTTKSNGETSTRNKGHPQANSVHDNREFRSNVISTRPSQKQQHNQSESNHETTMDHESHKIVFV